MSNAGDSTDKLTSTTDELLLVTMMMMMNTALNATVDDSTDVLCAIGGL